MINVDLLQICNQQFCQSTPDSHGGGLTSMQARSTINMERINNQHFTVHCQSLMEGGHNLAALLSPCEAPGCN